MGKNNYNNLTSSFMSSWLNFFQRMGVKPQDIYIDDLYHFGGNSNSSSAAIQTKDTIMSDLEPGVKKVVESMVQIYDETIKTKEDMLKKSRDLYETTAVQTIVDVSLDDGFNNFKEDKDFVISYEPSNEDKESLGDDFIKSVQTEIDSFCEKSGIKEIIADIVPDIIRDGEHAIALRVEQGKGVTGINDDLDVINMLPCYRGNNLVVVIEKTKTETSFAEQEKVRLYNPDNMVFFRLKHFKKQKINLDKVGLTKELRSNFTKKTGLDIPKYARMCLPLYASALDDIDTLRAMEKLAVAQDFVSILRNQVLGVGVPPNTTSEEAKRVVREYERHLNDVSQSLETFKNMSIDELINTASIRKILPNFTDGKGSITQMDVSTADKISQARDSVTNQRMQVALTVGYPTYYFTNTESPVDKSTALKLYSRYTKKLSGLQVCISEGTEEIIYRHLLSKGMKVKRGYVKAHFKALTNGDVLDDVDVMVATVTGLADMYDAMEKIASSENNELVIDSDKLANVWDMYTSNLANLTGLLKKDETKFDNSDEDISDLDGFNSPSGGGSASRERLSSSPSVEPSGPSSQELTPQENDAIDRANAEREADFVNSTSAEL